MDYKLKDLIDTPKLQALLDTLDEIYSLPSAIIDTDGNILTATAWQDICTKFHRINPETEKKCKESDSYIAKELCKNPPNVVYRCPMGLVDTATPIIVEGHHLGNVLTGQLFLEPPDRERFISQAREYGFNEKDYLDALKKVPVISEERLHKNLKFLGEFTQMLVAQGLIYKRQLLTEDALREKEERLKLATDSVKLGIWDWDLVHNTMIWDDRMLELYGLTWETFAGGIEAWQNVLHPDDRDKTIAGCEAALRGEKEWNTDFRVVHPDKTVRQIKANGIVVRDAKGAPARMLGVNFDITEHRKLEEQLRQSQKMEGIGQLAGGIAHDFNNILTAIIGYGSLSLMKMEDDDPNRLNIEHILEASEKAAHLTKDLLLFSRKQVIDRKTIDLNETIGRLQKFLIRIIGEDIICTTRLSDEKLMISGDSHQLEQVLMNLTTNARDAMPKGGAFIVTTEEIDLDEDFTTSHRLSKPGRYALISISDTGCGMDRETSEKIFEPFFTTKEVGKGTGLGLAVVYGIIKQHDGHINVYSEKGTGSTFRIYLPLIEAADREDKAAVAEEQPVVGGTETILMAEDEELLRKLNNSVLKEYGYTVMEAVDGEDAVNKYRENKDRIQLLLFDLVMPRMNGSEAYDEIRKITPDIRVIFVSGYSPDIVRQKELLDDNAELVYKPISPFALLRKVREVIDKNQK